MAAACPPRPTVASTYRPPGRGASHWSTSATITGRWVASASDLNPLDLAPVRRLVEIGGSGAVSRVERRSGLGWTVFRCVRLRGPRFQLLLRRLERHGLLLLSRHRLHLLDVAAEAGLADRHARALHQDAGHALRPGAKR